jgi:hypothetical protein
MKRFLLIHFEGVRRNVNWKVLPLHSTVTFHARKEAANTGGRLQSIGFSGG